MCVWMGEGQVVYGVSGCGGGGGGQFVCGVSNCVCVRRGGQVVWRWGSGCVCVDFVWGGGQVVCMNVCDCMSVCVCVCACSSFSDHLYLMGS